MKKSVIEDGEYNNQQLELSLKKKLKKEACVSLKRKGNQLQYDYNTEQLNRLEEANSSLEVG